MFKHVLFGIALSLMGVVANAQTTKAAAPTAAAADFSAVEGLVCRGFYDQSKGGEGSLERPEAAFKTTTIHGGKFSFQALAKTGVSRGWDTATGNAYFVQGDAKFELQPNGSWAFYNSYANSKYFLTPEASSDPSVKKFAVRYEAGKGWAAGKAECRPK